MWQYFNRQYEILASQIPVENSIMTWQPFAWQSVATTSVRLKKVVRAAGSSKFCSKKLVSIENQPHASRTLPDDEILAQCNVFELICHSVSLGN